MKTAIASMTALLLVSFSPATQDKDPFEEVTIAPSFTKAKSFKTFREGGVVADVKLYWTDFFGRKTVWAGALVTNPTKAKVYCQYYVAFFDKDKNLIGCAGQSLESDPGEKDMQLGSCLIQAPQAELKKIKYAQWRFFASDKEIGSR